MIDLVVEHLHPVMAGLFAFVSALAFFLHLRWRQLGRYHRRERQYMPTDLAEARLFASEKHFACDGRYPLSARVDQVYLAKSGLLYPTETKTRRIPVVYDSDIIELSAQAYVLKQLGHRVSPHGYVRLVLTGQREPTYMKVPLLTEGHVEHLHRHFHDIRRGAVKPRGASSRGLCNSCGHEPTCPYKGGPI